MVQTDDVLLLREAVESDCREVRFGSEFCEYKIPSLEDVERAYEIVHTTGKGFAYVTPRISNTALKQIQPHLIHLNNLGDMDVVVNDFGVLHLLKEYPHLHPHLGRQLVRVPSRSPYVDAYIRGGGWSGGWLKKVFASTSLNYPRTIEFLQSQGVSGVDVDWIPRLFSGFEFLVKRGFTPSVHLHLVPVTLARRCHTARFLGEEAPEECSQPCREKVFLLKNELYNLELYLNGNVAFHVVQPRREDVKTLKRSNVTEFVLPMNPITDIVSKPKINAFIKSFSELF